MDQSGGGLSGADAGCGRADACTGGLAAGDSDLRRPFLWSSALPSANLENSVGSGYRLGYFDGSDQFTELGRISETKISMLKTQNLYLSGGVYGTSGGAGAQVIGCWHIRLPGSYGDFSAAQAAAAASGGFPAWIDGTYQVRLGAYADEASARAAMTAAGISGEIVGTGPSGISVLATGTDRILFQFTAAHIVCSGSCRM